jgi:hypothetical protein
VLFPYDTITFYFIVINKSAKRKEETEMNETNKKFLIRKFAATHIKQLSLTHNELAHVCAVVVDGNLLSFSISFSSLMKMLTI